MCKNATRTITWSNPFKVDLRPLFVKASSSQLNDGLTITIRVIHITDADNYRIFDYLKSGNISAALDMIEEHKGVNAVDEWGQTSLMTAVQMKSLEVISSLLNTRMPRVNVNMAKSVRRYNDVVTIMLTNQLSCSMIYYHGTYHMNILSTTNIHDDDDNDDTASSHCEHSPDLQQCSTRSSCLPRPSYQHCCAKEPVPV